jgi:hypothetical protein
MKRAMDETVFRSGIRMHADGATSPVAAAPGVPSTCPRRCALTTTTKKLGKTTR